MHTTQIGIFKIAQTRVNWPSVLQWLSFLGVKNAEKVISEVNPDGNQDAAGLIALCGKRCYASFDVESGLNPNVTRIRTNLAEYITNVLKSGHGSVFEHATWSFAIENISRVFTGEMNRHRAGVAISEASMRYIRFDDIGFTTPESIRTGFGGPDWDKKEETQHVLKEAFTAAQEFYSKLCNIWGINGMKDFAEKKKLTSMFRRIIGMGVSTGGVWTINARALRHILALRGSVHAEEEIFYVFDQIADIMIADEPLLFGDFEKTDQGWVPKYPKV